jgi:hypothetical protein
VLSARPPPVVVVWVVVGRIRANESGLLWILSELGFYSTTGAIDQVILLLCDIGTRPATDMVVGWNGASLRPPIGV